MSTNRLLKSSLHLHDITTLQRHTRRRYWTHQVQCHDYHELIYVIRGRFEIESPFEEIHPGYLAFFSAGTTHKTRFLPPGRSGFSNSALLLQWKGPRINLSTKIHDQSGRLRTILEWMMGMYTGSPEDRLAARALLFPFLHELISITEERAALLPMIDVYIEENLADRFTVSDLAASVGLTRAHFSRVFKKIKGVSPMHYVTQIRLREASARLSNPNLTLENIAGATGFSSASHLIKVYKREMGHTPRKRSGPGA